MILKNVILNNQKVDIAINDGVISSIGQTEEDGIDLNGLFIYPGLIDIHTHGCMGFDTMDGGSFSQMSDFMFKNGVTSYLPTTMTVDIAKIKNVVKNYKNEAMGANILGFHLEGPYISQKFKGAQNEKYIKNPDINEFNELENVKMITIAPELEGGIDFIKKCPCVVSLGHTDCDFYTAISAIESGAKCLTHTFNAMNGLHHRNPGPIGAAIDKNIYIQVICDGLHIHKSVIKMLYKTFGAERVILISDSMRATGLGDGEYEFGGQKINVINSAARTEDGALAGSTTTLLSCVKKAIEFGITKEEAIKSATQTPAELLNIKKGKIAPGYDADLIITDDKLNIKNVVVCGEFRL